VKWFEIVIFAERNQPGRGICSVVEREDKRT